MKAILVSVDYGDILALTLPYNRHHFSDVMVVTTPYDEETQQVAKDNNAQLHITADFYKDGAVFNKWVPLEQGLDLLGREGWLVIMDADIAWPKHIPDMEYQVGTLYSPRRYLNPDITIPPEDEWKKLPVHQVYHIWAGYSQIFHADDPVLKDRPWFMDHKNAGGPDTVFQCRWKSKQRLSWKCLHIGPTETNWGGRVSPKADGSIVPGAEQRQQKLPSLIESHRKEFRKYTR